MTKRKKDMGKHVTLTEETVQKLLDSATPDGPVYLDPWDILALERAELHVKQCCLNEARLQNQKLQFEMQLQQQVIERERSSAVAQELAASIATRYGFDWQTHAYNPETGEITRPQEG